MQFSEKGPVASVASINEVSSFRGDSGLAVEAQFLFLVPFWKNAVKLTFIQFKSSFNCNLLDLLHSS